MEKTCPTFTNGELTLPEAIEIEKLFLRSLLTHLAAEVSTFETRRSQHRLLEILSPEQIQIGAEQGKVKSSDSELDQKVEADAAVEIALQASEDGLCFVFIDDEQVETLDATVMFQPTLQLIFLRLGAWCG